jgi:hypothetical protein
MESDINPMEHCYIEYSAKLTILLFGGGLWASSSHKVMFNEIKYQLPVSTWFRQAFQDYVGLKCCTTSTSYAEYASDCNLKMYHLHVL